MDYNLKDLTIVITTYNRPKCLISLVEFYLSLNSELSILILDSSKIIDELNIREKYKNNNKINYMYFNTNTFVIQKVGEGSKNISTKFSVLCADDDFLFPTGLQACINFLSENDDYVSCHGKYFLHFYSKIFKKKLIKFEEIHKFGKSSYSESPLERVSNYLTFKNNAIGPFYAVHKTEIFKKIWFNSAKNIFDWSLSELMPCALSLGYGKMKSIKVIYCSREPNYNFWYNIVEHQRGFSQKHTISSVNMMADELYKNHKISKENTKSLIKYLLEDYFIEKKNLLISQEDIVNKLKDKIRSLMKNKIKLIKNIYRNSVLDRKDFNDLEFKSFSLALAIRSKISSDEVTKSRNENKKIIK